LPRQERLASEFGPEVRLGPSRTANTRPCEAAVEAVDRPALNQSKATSPARARDPLVSARCYCKRSSSIDVDPFPGNVLRHDLRVPPPAA